MGSYNMKKLLFAVLLLAGCQVRIHSIEPIPTTTAKLNEYIAAKEAKVESLEKSLIDAKESRDIIVESNKNVTGYFAKGDANARISHATNNIETIAFHLTCEKETLAEAKARLNNLKETAQ